MRQILLFCLFGLPAFVFAQPNISMSDAILKGRTSLAPSSLRQLQWIPGSTQFSHVSNGKVVRVNAATDQTDTMDLQSKLNEGMPGLGLKPLEALPAFTWLSADKLWFQTGKEIITWSATGGMKLENQFPADAEHLDIHAATYHAAYLVGEELRISTPAGEQNIVKSEGPGIKYGTSVHRDEFGISKGTFWSNAGKKLAFYRMDESMVTEYPIYVLDSMPAQARMVRYPYAGAKSHHVTIGVYDLNTGKTIYLQTGVPQEQYLTNVSWSADDRYILVAVLNREQNHCKLNRYDAATGAFIGTILEEKSDKWVEPENPAQFVPGSNSQFVWQSERDNYNHLYLYDINGTLLRQLSKGAMPVTRFYGFSADGKQAFYQVADESGLNRHLYAVNLKTGVLAKLSQEEGTHNGIFHPQGEWVLDNFSNLETPRLIYAFRSERPDSRKIVFGAKNPLEGYNLGLTRMVTLPSAGGFTLQARMILPPDFSASKQYPAIVYVYNGPHVQMVTNTWLGGAELWMHHMAQEGFVVFVLDGRGSSNRGLLFENAIHRRLGDAEIEDQLIGVSYLKAQGFIDPARIGVYGWSYGGFMTTSLLTRPEAAGVFKCGVAGGPVIDWRMYEIMYTERYMDTPQENPEGYNKNSLFNHIDNLKGRLLMIHGSSDDVVLWQHSLRYIRECVRRGKPIDYFVYPEHLHNVMGKDRVHLFEKIERFFKENL
ncbi:MAG: DPP IV N-terminal domain-containing protein [Chitinophagales bacterium]|nr:DPP IV N-terminal domain-containing protein [Chitinophagales bacterium]